MRRKFALAIETIISKLIELPAASCMGILACVNLATFVAHYAGHATFPWDFLGGYHAHGFAWYSQGGMFNPPRWFPWADGGFPAFMALQSGAWYLPLEVMKLLHIEYSIENATRLQCLHVLFGSIGALFFCRLLSIGWRAALIAALCYHFSVGFYSNQQHVDIIRGAAWFPWVLLLTSPRYLSSSSWAIPTSSVAVFQFLVSSYPGLIVSTGYIAFVVWAFTIWHDRTASVQSVVCKSAIVAIAAALMATLKFGPILTHGDTILDRTGAETATITTPMFATLMMPYDVEIIPSDVTMRSIWIPSVAIVGLVFLNRLTLAVFIGLILIGAAIIFGSQLFTPYVYGVLPGLSLSRFPISDWRPILHVGIVIVAASAIEPFLSSKKAQGLTKGGVTLRLALVALQTANLALLFAIMGYSNPAIGGMLAGVAAISAVVWFAHLKNEESIDRYQAVCRTAAVACLTIASGVIYHKSQDRTWHVPWSPVFERENFGEKLEFADLSSPYGKMRRPSRMLLGATPSEALRLRNHPKYNTCWYNKSFCSLGYNNLKLSKPHVTLVERLGDVSDGSAVLSFLSRAQQVVALPEGQEFDPKAVAESSEPSLVSFVPNVSATMVGYEAHSVRYQIHSGAPIQIVENELWATGWSVRRCNADNKCVETAAEHTQEYFRRWTLPQGDWSVELRYAPDLYRVPFILASLGLGLALLLPLCFGWRRIGCIRTLPQHPS